MSRVVSRWADETFERARAIADAVLWEGYVLYPYRRSAAKNRLRFQWGVVGPAEEPTMATEVLVDADAFDVAGGEHLAVRVRFLHLQRRDDGWDEAVAVDRDVEVRLDVPGQAWLLDVPAGPGAEQLTGVLRVTTSPSASPSPSPSPSPSSSPGTGADDAGGGRLVRVRAEVENTTAFSGGARDEALLASFIGCHLLFASPGDAFVSLLEPPAWAVGAAAACRQHRCWPVLVGPAPARDLVMASPVILYDYAGVAPESVGDFFDGTEIDEMLTLRVQTLTDAEKAEARATDPRAAAIIDRCDDTSPETLLSLHGTQRGSTGGAAGAADADQSAGDDPLPDWSQPGPAEALVVGVWVTKGSKVRLRPLRRADAHDIFLVGRVATVVDVVHDVDDEVHVAVTVDDDPAAELFEWHGRYLYFAPDELEPLEQTHG